MKHFLSVKSSVSIEKLKNGIGILHNFPRYFCRNTSCSVVSDKVNIHEAERCSKSLNSITSLPTRQYSFYFKKKLESPVKCRLKIKECGQKITEKPFRVKLQAQNTDFTLNLDKKCQEKLFFQTEFHLKNYSTPELECSNALTKYLKTKYESSNKSIDGGTILKAEEPCSFKETMYKRTDYILDSHKTSKKVSNLVCKLESKNMLNCKTNENLALHKLTSNIGEKAARQKLTFVENTLLSSCQKTILNKFGVEDMSKQFSTEEALIHTSVLEKTNCFAVRSNCTTDTISNMKSSFPSGKINSNLQGTLPAKAVSSMKKAKKVKKNDPNKPFIKKKVRRKRKTWASRIPIEPNVKGSVIFANGSQQIFEDPCKILSVNFNSCEDTEAYFESESKLINDDIVTENMYLESSSVEVDLPKEVPISNENLKTNKLTKVRINKNANKTFLTPMIRRKKVSKLDKSIQSFTTVIPDNGDLTSAEIIDIQDDDGLKDLLKVLSMKQDYNDRLLKSSIELNQNSGSSTTNSLEIEQISPGTCSSIGLNFLRKIQATSRLPTKPSSMKIKESEAPRKKTPYKVAKMDIRPGLTRPVTEKIATLDITRSQMCKPISNTWKNGAASVDRIPHHTEKKNKKWTRSTNDLMTAPKDFRVQQTRLQSTWKPILPWKSRCECPNKPCPNQKKKDIADEMYPNWKNHEPLPKEVARKWNTWDCPQEKELGCPITSEDLKKGVPCRKPMGAAALNRCNFEECRNRSNICCRKPLSKCRVGGDRNK